MLEALIFDIGNVLLAFDFQHAFEKLKNQSDGCTPEAMEEVERLKVLCESGMISRKVFEIDVIEVLKFRGTPADFSLIWQEIFTVNQPMVDFVESLEGRLPLYLLSNTSAIHLEHILAKYPVFGRFADAIYSHEARLAKPDPAIFHLAVKQFGVVPEKTGFIDDLIANIESARSVGFNCFHYDLHNHEKTIAAIEAQL